MEGGWEWFRKADLNAIIFLLYGDNCQNCDAGSENESERIDKRPFKAKQK